MIGLTKKLKNPAEKEKFKIPKTVQQSIPITKIFKDGILLCGNLYTKSWKFTDVNYSVASSDDQVNMFLAYSEILNSLAIDATTKITINNRQLNKEEFKQRERYNVKVVEQICSLPNTLYMAAAHLR